MNAISQVFWEDTLENGTVSHVAGQAGSPWSVLISLNAHRTNSLTASHLDIPNCTSCHMRLFCWIFPIWMKAVPHLYLFQTHKHSVYWTTCTFQENSTSIFRLQDRPQKQNKTAHLIFALEKQPCKQEMRHKHGLQVNKEHLWGREASVSPRKSSAPTETHTFPEWNGLFLGTQSLFVSHICLTIQLCGERLASYQSTADQVSPSYPCWKYTELPVTALTLWEMLLCC